MKKLITLFASILFFTTLVAQEPTDKMPISKVKINADFGMATFVYDWDYSTPIITPSTNVQRVKGKITDMKLILSGFSKIMEGKSLVLKTNVPIAPRCTNVISQYDIKAGNYKILRSQVSFVLVKPKVQ
jgi:hypothetical protein